MDRQTRWKIGDNWHHLYFDPRDFSNVSQPDLESVMTHFRFIPLAAALASAIVLVACTSPPAMPAGDASAHSMGTPDRMAGMDTQMKTMRAMHEKMMNAKTPEERNKLMAEHMKTMHDGMEVMGGMGAMAGMGGMQGNTPMAGDMAARQQMMEKRMEMMQAMMKMMMDRMPTAPAK